MGDESWRLENVLKRRPFPRDETVLFVLSFVVIRSYSEVENETFGF